MGIGCFYKCKSLSEVKFESNSKLKEIGEFTFYKCGIRSIEIPNNVERIGGGCFFKCCSLCEVIFESGSKLSEICGLAFQHCPAMHVIIPEGFVVRYEWPSGCRIEVARTDKGNCDDSAPDVGGMET
jgi:hypothetical protein